MIRSDNAIVRGDSLFRFLEHARAGVDAALEGYLPKPPACPALVSEAMRYSVFAGGKRLRPALALASADAVARQRLSPSESAQSFRDATSLALPGGRAL